MHRDCTPAHNSIIAGYSHGGKCHAIVLLARCQGISRAHQYITLTSVAVYGPPGICHTLTFLVDCRFKFKSVTVNDSYIVR